MHWYHLVAQALKCCKKGSYGLFHTHYFMDCGGSFAAGHLSMEQRCSFVLYMILQHITWVLHPFRGGGWSINLIPFKWWKMKGHWWLWSLWVDHALQALCVCVWWGGGGGGEVGALCPQETDCPHLHEEYPPLGRGQIGKNPGIFSPTFTPPSLPPPSSTAPLPRQLLHRIDLPSAGHLSEMIGFGAEG